jgi:membrane-associated phospholipid phosphatase
MHWLQSLDDALFRFINGTLANQFFDWLMPVLSGVGVPWLLLGTAGVAVILFFGSVRLKICTLFMLLVVALGDPLVVGTVKDSVQRPRPFVVLNDARLFGKVGAGYGKTNNQSMPSAHAANNFAIATIGIFFYRRSAKFLFPLAAAVAFSRVYNGVHYPTDVLVGAILGCGYAITFLLAAQTCWNFFGRKFFPAWHEQLPNLLNPVTHPPPLRSGAASHASRITHHEWLRLGYLLIALALVGRWIYLASGVINLSGDEAYQWLWSKHLALSYYSKPPGIAVLQRISTTIFGDTELGVRFFSPLIAALMGMLLLRFTAREIGERPAFVLLLMTFAAPLLVAGSVLMTIDPPLVLCWMCAVVAGWRAMQPDGKARDWIFMGLALGLGFLFKYTAALQLVCWLIFFLLKPAARIHLKNSGAWLALGIFALCTLPVVIWNAQHSWITVNHVAGDAGLHGDWHFTLDYFWEFTGAQLGLLNPIFFIAALIAMWGAWKQRAEKPLWFFLLCMSAPVFFGHWLYAFHSRVLPNWIAAAVPPMFCLTVAFWSERRFHKHWFCLAMVIGLFAAVIMHDTRLVKIFSGSPLPGDADPAHRSAGWRETALFVDAARVHFDTNAFIIADHYGPTGLYSFYSHRARAAAATDKPLVYCVDSETPINQFPFWDEYNYRQHRRGENAVFVLRLDPYPLECGWFWKWLRHEPVKNGEAPPPRAVPPRIAAEFESVTNLGIREIKLRDGRIFQRVQIFGCTHLK